MNKKILYPVTIPSKVVNVDDPTLPKKDGQYLQNDLSAVLQNMANAYANGEVSDESWNQHGTLGGVTANTPLVGLSALDILKQILLPEWYPYKTGDNSFSIKPTQTDNAKFLLGTFTPTANDCTTASTSTVKVYTYAKDDFNAQLYGTYLAGALFDLVLNVTNTSDDRARQYKYSVKLTFTPSTTKTTPILTTKGQTVLLADKAQLMSGLSSNLVDLNGYLKNQTKVINNLVLYTGYLPDYVVLTSVDENTGEKGYTELYGEDTYVMNIERLVDRVGGSDGLFYSRTEIEDNENTDKKVLGEFLANVFSPMSIQLVDASNPTVTLGCVNGKWVPIDSSNSEQATNQTIYYCYYAGTTGNKNTYARYKFNK